MLGLGTIIGTCVRRYNKQAVNILLKGGVVNAREIARKLSNRTLWTGRLVPDRLFENNVNSQIIEELDKAGLLGTKISPVAAILYERSSIADSIKESRTPSQAITLSELSAKVGENVRVEAYTSLTRDMKRELREIVRESFFRDLWQTNEDFDYIAAQKDFRIIIVRSESSGKILGFAVGLYNSDYPDDAYYIYVLAVRNHYCGKGIGKALLQAYFKELSEPGYMNYKMVYLSCSKYDKYGRDLVKYYQKYGFVEAGIKRGRFSMVAPTAHYEA